MQTKLKLDLKRLANSALATNLSRHLKDYEAKVKKVVHGFDLKSRDARAKSKKQLDQFAVQLKKTRGQIEKKVVTLAQEEGERLNKRVVELVNYLKSVAGNEKIASRSAQPGKKKTSKGASPRNGGTKRAPKKRSVIAVVETASDLPSQAASDKTSAAHLG